MADDEGTTNQEFDRLSLSDGSNETARRVMVENFGELKPIPPETKKRHVRFQEAARLLIHHHWSIDRIAETLGIRSDYLSKIKSEDGWEEFAASISETLKPSIWLQNDFDVLDKEIIRQEHDRRIETLPDLKREEKRILDNLTCYTPGSIPYNNAMSALRMIRNLIDDATGATMHRREQSAARGHVIKKTIDKKFNPATKAPGQEFPGDNAPRTPGREVKIFEA